MQELLETGTYTAKIISMYEPEIMKTRSEFFVRVNMKINGEDYFIFLIGNLELCAFAYFAKEFYLEKEAEIRVKKFEFRNTLQNQFTFIRLLGILP